MCALGLLPCAAQCLRCAIPLPHLHTCTQSSAWSQHHPPTPVLALLSLCSAQEHGLAHEVLSPAEVAARHPAFHLPRDFKALVEPEAGLLAPERCIAAHLALAQQHGAQLLCGARLQGWRVEQGSTGRGGARVHVHSSAGSFVARRLVLAGGGWMPQLVPELQVRCGVASCSWGGADGVPRWFLCTECGGSCCTCPRLDCAKAPRLHNSPACLLNWQLRCHDRSLPAAPARASPLPALLQQLPQLPPRMPPPSRRSRC